MHPMHPMQAYINLYIILIQVYASMHPMHPMQPYINLYIFSYTSLCIYASYAAVYKLVYISYTSLGITRYDTLN